jgi:hypothetical protein
MTYYYTIQGRDTDGEWDESLAGDDSDANRFDTIEEARSALSDLLATNPEYSTGEWRVMEKIS